MRRATTRTAPHEPRRSSIRAPRRRCSSPARRLARAGVRFDALTTANRPGRRNALLHRLERRALGRTAVLLPTGLGADRPVPAAVLHSHDGDRAADPCRAPAGAPERREPVVLTYAGNPDKKGLDMIAAAWAPPHRGRGWS